MLRIVLGVVLIVASRSRPAASEAERGRFAGSPSETFAWFSGLGYPDVKQGKFVHVATGHWSRSVGEPPQNFYLYGFLLSDSGDAFSVFRDDLAIESFVKSPSGTAEYGRVGYEVANLSQVVTEYLEASQHTGDRSASLHLERELTRIETFFLSWVCWRIGHESLATKLYDQAVHLPNGRRVTRPTFRQELADEIAYDAMWRAVMAFGDPRISRAELLTVFERFVKNFPESEYMARAKVTAALLQRMVREDEEHGRRRKQGEPFDQLARREQIAELIFQLRNQNGHQWSQPGSCDVFSTPNSSEDSPAHKLARLGYEAFPQLLEALEDERFTRSVGYHRNFYFSHSVLRVSDCVEQILTRIAGRRFSDLPNTEGETYEAFRAEEIRRVASAWYSRIREKGEEVVLLEEVGTGGRRAARLAERLVEKYPGAALPALMAGARNATDPWARARFVHQAGKIEGEASLRFLLEELGDGPALPSRLAAADSLFRRGCPEGASAMIEEWNQSKRRPGADAWVDGREVLIGFLAGCGDVGAVEALAGDFESWPVEVRLQIVEALDGSGVSTDAFVLEHGSLDCREDAPPSREVREAIVRLLVGALTDTEPKTGMGGSRNDKEFHDPRICDMAGEVLNELDEKRFPFDLAASIEERDRSRLALMNAWSKEHGLPERAEP